jgi:DegV family protein with EDD domain
VLGARRVTVVTDSATDVPRPLRDENGINVVPLSLTFGEESVLDGVDITSASVLAEIRQRDRIPKTSQPPSSMFADAYRTALADGMDVVSMHISSDASGTFNSERIAAGEADPNRISVVDWTGSVILAYAGPGAIGIATLAGRR